MLKFNRLEVPGVASSDPLLNTYFRVASLREAKLGLKELMQRRNGQVPPTDEEVTREYGVFRECVRQSSGPFEEHIRPAIRPEFQILPTLHVFHIYVEDCLQRLLVHCPDNNELRNRWSQCRSAIVDYRYSQSAQDFQQILQFIEYIQDQLKLYGQEVAPEKEKAFWEAWRKLFNHADVMEFNFLSLHAAVDDQKLYACSVSVQYQIECYLFIARQLHQNLIWIMDEIERTLRPFADKPQHPIYNNSQRILEHLKKLRQELLPKVEKLLVEDLQRICSNFPFLKQTEAMWFNTSGESWGNLLSDTTKYIAQLTGILANEKERKSAKDTEGSDESDQVEVIEVDPQTQSFIISTTTEGILRTAIDYFQAHSRCHRMWDTYISTPVESLLSIVDHLVQWQVRLGKTKQLDLALQKLTVERFGPQPERKQLSKAELDQLVAEFEGDSKTKKGGKAAAASSSSASRSKKKNSEEKTKEPAAGRELPSPIAKPIAKAVPIPSVALPVEQKAWDPYSDALIRICAAFHVQELHYKRIAVRQTFMTVQDLHVLRRRLEGPFPRSHHLALASAVWQSSYRHLEQLFRYTLLVQKHAGNPQEKLDAHHLIWFEKQIALPGGLNREIVHRLFLANLWDDLTYEQHARRSQLLRNKQALPLVLQDARRMAESRESTETEQALGELPKLVGEVFKFVHAVPLDSSLGIASEPVPKKQMEMRFDAAWKASIEGFREIEAGIKSFLAKHEVNSLHPGVLKFRQLLKDLKVLEGNIHRLSDGISSLEFPLVVRNICHWEHAVAQHMLQALVYLKTGEDLGEKHEHELAAIYKAMPWTKGASVEEVQFLEDYFRDIHRLSFYPFDNREIANRLHHAILAAEMLREHPISQVGFQDQGTTKGQAVTSLNFIPVDAALLKAERVLAVLEEAHTGLLRLMTQRCLPELKQLSG